MLIHVVLCVRLELLKYVHLESVRALPMAIPAIEEKCYL